MTIEVNCDACRYSFNLKDQSAGKRGKCPKCGEAVVVPQKHSGAPRRASSNRERGSSKQSKARNGGSARKKRRSRPQPAAFSVPIPVAIGSGVLFPCLIFVVIYAVFFKSSPQAVTQPEHEREAIETNTLAEPVGENKLDFAYLPLETEIVFSLRVNNVWNSKTVQAALEYPLLNALIQFGRDQSGYSPEDLEYVVGGIARREYSQEASMVVVARTKTALQDRLVTTQKLSQATHAGKQYYVSLNSALYFPEERTMVIAQLDDIEGIIDRGSAAPRLPQFDFVDPEQDALVAFAECGTGFDWFVVVLILSRLEIDVST